MVQRKITYWFLFLYMVLLPGFFIPNVFVSQNAIAKIAFSFLCVGALYLLFCWISFQKKEIQFPWHITASSLTFFGVIILFSTLFSRNTYMSVFGSEYEADSLIVLSLLFVVFLFTLQQVRTKVTQIIIYSGFFLSAFPWLLFELLRLNNSGLDTFLENGFLVGSLFNTFILLGGLLLGAFLFATSSQTSYKIRWVLSVFIILFFSAGLLLFNVFNEKITNISDENAVSFDTTIHIGTQTILENPSQSLIGSGPNTFLYQWLQYRPDNVYEESLWETKPSTGNNFLTTLLATTGLLGVFSILLFLGLFIIYGIRKINLIHSVFYTTSYVLSIYFFISFLLFTNSSFIGVYAFLFTGLTVGFLSSLRTEKIFNIEPKTTGRIYAYVVLFLFTLMYILGGTYFVRESYAAQLFYKGIESAKNENFNEAIEDMNKATKSSSRDMYLRELSLVYHQAASKNQAYSHFGSYTGGGLRTAQDAIKFNNTDYRNHIAYGRMLALLFQFSDSEVGDKTIIAYDSAVDLNTMDPLLLLERAYISVLYKDFEKAKEFVKKALKIKPDYEEAQILLKSLN